MSPDDHIRLLDHKKVAVNDRGMEVEEEATASLLIHTITLHFLGNPKEDRAAAKSVSSILDVPLLQIIGGTKMSFSQMF